MNRYILLFSLIFISLSFNVNANTVVSGIMKNAYLNDRIELRLPHYFVNGKSTSVVELTDSQGRFNIHVKVYEPQVAFLIHNEDRLAIYLEPDDSLFISSDVFQFPLAVSFGGRGAHSNRLYRKFLQENPNDFNEFNNLRYKIGYYWTTVESDMDNSMNSLPIEAYKDFIDKRKISAFALLDEYQQQFPNEISHNFKEFLSAEILYDWAYHLLFYGNIYKNKHGVGDEFFEFLYDAPTSNEMVGSENYRRFLLTYMAWKQKNSNHPQQVYANQYLFASDFLSGKALDFFRSEIVLLALKAEQYAEILPFYTSFLQNSKHIEYQEKVTDLYEKAVKVSPGITAPDISTTDIFGNNFSLGNLRGKVIYINFWASWCAACIKKMNYFDDFATELENKGIIIVNVSLDENQENWSNSIIEQGFRGIQLLSTRTTGTSIAKRYNVEAVPQYFLIGKNGSFVEKGYSNQPEDIKNRLRTCKNLLRYGLDCIRGNAFSWFSWSTRSRTTTRQ